MADPANAVRIMMLAPGGSVHSRRVLELLLNRGHHVVFVDSVDPAPATTAGYAFHRFERTRLERLLGRFRHYRRVRCVLDLVAARRVRAVWGRVRPDLVHVHWVGEKAFECSLAGIRPLVLTVWGSDINMQFYPEADPGDILRVGLALRRADMVLVDAADMLAKCELMAGNSVPGEVLTLGIDTGLFRPGYEDAVQEWRQRLHIPEAARIVYSARALHPLYRQHVILEAFSRASEVLKGRGLEAILLCKSYKTSAAGTPYELAVRQIAARLGIEDQIRWIDELPLAELPTLYALSDVVVSYPALDAFPVTFLEAAACERPVITSKIPSYEGTFAEVYFRMVSRDDVRELDAALVDELLTPITDRSEALAAARAVVVANFDEKLLVARLINIYQRLIDRAEDQAKGHALSRN